MSTFALAPFIPTTGAYAQGPDFENATIETTELADGVYMLACMGTNIGLSIGNQDAFVVDSCWTELSDKLVAAIEAQTDNPVTFVVNTHWHGDHTGGNERFGTMGSVIVAHEKSRERLRVDTPRWPSGRVLKASPAIALPVMTLSDRATFYQNGQQIDLISVSRAHTDGDIVVVFREANVIHAGDVFLNGSYPSIEYDKNGSLEGMIAAVNMIIDMSNDETKVIPGHLDLGNKADVIRYRDMLLTIRSRVMEGQASGKPIEDLLAEKPLSDLEGDWGSERGPLFRKGNDVYELIFNEEQFDQ